MKLKKIIAVALAAVLSLSLMACGNSDEVEKSTVDSMTEVEKDQGETLTGTEDLPVLKVAVMPFLNSIPVKYMMDHGLDVENGFKIETVYFANGGAMNEALAADEWEVGTLSAAAVNSLAIYGAYNVADIGHSEGGLYTLVAEDSPIAKVKGSNPSYPDIYGDADTVKGSVIATNTGTISHLNVIKWLEAIGLTIDDVEIVSMDFPSAYQALLTGNCDIAALNPPTSYQAEEEGYVVSSSLTTLQVPQYDSIISSAKAHDERADVVTNYIKAFFQATDALYADPEMATQLLYDWYTENGSDTTMESCAIEIETRPFVTSEEAKTITIGESCKITGEFWVSQKLLVEEKYPEIAKHIDDSLVKAALGY
ncbi:MAG TPA: ABC transporter substrate-binding protein [Candidatus Merdenecus merdavium]|nr:ABC transporter substrate-binding protein [Candidatus Merdenecus merdavium]